VRNTAVRVLRVKDERELWSGYAFVLYTFLTINFSNHIISYSEPGSSVSTVAGYGLDNRAIEVRSSAEAKRLFL
jgi:hypothetical protein